MVVAAQPFMNDFVFFLLLLISLPILSSVSGRRESPLGHWMSLSSEPILVHRVRGGVAVIVEKRIA